MATKALRKLGRKLLLLLARNPFRNKHQPPSNFHSVLFEISVLYTVILGIILVFFSGVLYLMLFYTLYIDLDSELKVKAQEISQSINTYMEIKGQDETSLRFAVDQTIAQQGKRLSRWWIIGFERRWFEQIERMDLEENLINFVSPDKQSISVSRSMSPELVTLFMQNLDQAIPLGGALKNIRSNHLAIRILNYPFSYHGQPYILQIGAYQKPIDEAVLAWLNSALISIPIVLLFTSFAGRLLARRILNPVEEITEAARKITYHDLSARVKTHHSYQEMENLVGAFNEMISRLETSFKHIEEFSYNVAHELKTPLTIIKGEAEVTLMSKRSVEEYEEVLRTHLQEADKMLRTIEDLLYIGRLDYQPDVFKFGELNLGEFLSEVYQQSKILALRKKIKVNLHLPSEAMTIKADPAHLRRLFLNLIDNALKFTPAEGHIDILVKSVGNKVIVSVVDTGKGILPEDLPHVFEKFYRGDDTTSGTGLGLNIVKSIAKIHNATIQLESQMGQGTSVHVTFLLV